MKHKKLASLGIFGLVGLLAMTLVFAYQGDPNVEGPNFSEDRHEEMEKAFDSLDYEAWKEIMTENGRNPRIVDVVNEDNFGEFVEAREAALNGDKSALIEFMESNGFGPEGMNHGEKQGRMPENCPHHEDGNQKMAGNCPHKDDSNMPENCPMR